MNIIQKALKVMEKEFKAGEGKYDQSALVMDYCRLQLGNEPEEVFSIMFLNSQFELLAFDKLFRGSISESNISARAIARRMFELNAAKIILAHNHPSGKTEPSKADIEVTKHLNALFKQLDCQIVDHIIVSPISSYSMATEMAHIF